MRYPKIRLWPFLNLVQTGCKIHIMDNARCVMYTHSFRIVRLYIQNIFLMKNYELMHERVLHTLIKCPSSSLRRSLMRPKQLSNSKYKLSKNTLNNCLGKHIMLVKGFGTVGNSHRLCGLILMEILQMQSLT